MSLGDQLRVAPQTFDQMNNPANAAVDVCG